MPRVPAFLSRLFPKLFGRADATVEPANLRDAPRLSQLHRASFHRGWGTDEFEQILIERNALAHRLRLGG
ncbi:MAG TPA: ribosomal-protein-alanine N-acetyltransferase RimI, partial [Afipia sp.]|nr:ribosomal-protein-alanine N-acetyltransferase RimI [Afipia sp.]